MSPRPAARDRGEETRASLVKAAHEILSSEGMQGITTRSVANRAGVALSLVHHHFGGKRGLLMAVMNDDLARVGRYEELLAEAATLFDAWEILVREFGRDLETGTVRAEWETFVVGLGDPEFSRQWQIVTQAWRALYQRVIDRLLPDGVIPPLPSSTIASILVDYFLGTEAVLLAEAATGGPASPPEHLARVGEMIRAFEADRA